MSHEAEAHSDISSCSCSLDSGLGHQSSYQEKALAGMPVSPFRDSLFSVPGP